MPTNDRVRAFLREKGCGEHIVERGVEGLVESWEKIAQSVEDGYSLGLDDYLNDMDARQLLDDSLIFATPSQVEGLLDRITRADMLMRSLTERVPRCLWGDEVAAEERWTPVRNWWYFSRPINANPELLEEIREAID